jgi:hypothetical protein
MSDSINNRSAAVRHYLDRKGADPTVARRYSLVAARWDALRLAIHRGQTTPADDVRFRELSQILQALTVKLGLGTNLTDARGFLPSDPQRIICRSWVEAAAGW